MSTMPLPEPGRSSAERFVADRLSHLVADEVRGSETIAGGQRAADAALASFDVTDYAESRSNVGPIAARGASGLSPYIRHGLLHLGRVWRHVADGPKRDVEAFRRELLWQEYARHWYARYGRRTRRGVRREQLDPGHHPTGWDRTMSCLDTTLAELERDGWLVNQSRMWLASHWAVRLGLPWRDGEDEFFRHLLDGSRAANRLGWQWTTGVGSSKAYGFSRWQIEKRAPGLCHGCAHEHDCPIGEWPKDPPFGPDTETLPTAALFGPSHTIRSRAPEAVWLTAESLGVADPALQVNEDLPAIFVFDEPLLARLRLSSKRLVFLVESLAELGTQRPVELRLGDPVTELTGRPVAVTHAPVPGFAPRSRIVDTVEVHPWPWLVLPTGRSVSSFSRWRRSVEIAP